MADEKTILTYQKKLNSILEALIPNLTENLDAVLYPTPADAKSIIIDKSIPHVFLNPKHYTYDFWKKKYEQFNGILLELNKLHQELPKDPRLINMSDQAIANIAAAMNSIKPLFSKLTMHESKFNFNTTSTEIAEKSTPTPTTTADSIQQQKENLEPFFTSSSEYPFPGDKKELARKRAKAAKNKILNDSILIPDLNREILAYLYRDCTIITLAEINDKLLKGDKDFSYCDFSPADSADCHHPLDLQIIFDKHGKDCFEGAIFKGAYLNEINLSFFSIKNIDFTEAILKGIILINCLVTGCRFNKANLRHAQIQGSQWTGDNNVIGANFDRAVCNHQTDLYAVDLENIESMHFLHCEGPTFPVFRGNNYFSDKEFLSLLEISHACAAKDVWIARKLLYNILEHFENQSIIFFNHSIIKKIAKGLFDKDYKPLYAAAKEVADLESSETSSFFLPTELLKFFRYFQEYTGVKVSTFLEYFSQYCSQKHISLTPYNIEKPEWFYAILLDAKKGNKRGQYFLGYLYKYGDGVKKNLKEAVRLFNLADSQGYLYATLELGRCYRDGHGVEKNFTTAFEHFNRAKKLGNMAEVEIGNCLFFGDGVKQDVDRAFGLFKNLETYLRREDNPSPKFSLGRCYEEGKGVKKDLTKALKYYTAAANAGSHPAQYRLGELYESGTQIHRDLQQAFNFYRQAAMLGNDSALLKLGRCYEYGRGVAQDLKLAFKFYQLLAERGSADGQMEVGLCYETGVGVDQDLTEAFKFYQLAAEQGFTLAQKKIASCYQYEKCIDQDLTKSAASSTEHLKEAIKHYRTAIMKQKDWSQFALIHPPHNFKNAAKDLMAAIESYRHAVAQADPRAQVALGYCYANGHGVKTNLTLAINLFQLAAAQNNKQAQFFLGHCYETGNGVNTDLKKAAENYKHALTDKKSLFASSAILMSPPSSSASSPAQSSSPTNTFQAFDV